MLKRPWLFIVLVAMALAGLLSLTASNEPFEETLVRLEVERALPALEPTLQEESAEINALFLHYASDQALWMSAALAMLRHGDIRNLLGTSPYLPPGGDRIGTVQEQARQEKRLLPAKYRFDTDPDLIERSPVRAERDLNGEGTTQPVVRRFQGLGQHLGHVVLVGRVIDHLKQRVAIVRRECGVVR